MEMMKGSDEIMVSFDVLSLFIKMCQLRRL